MVPSSSAHWSVGSTTSAIFAVSDRKKSPTTRKSSERSFASTLTTLGADTVTFEPNTSSALAPPSLPRLSSSS